MFACYLDEIQLSTGRFPAYTVVQCTSTCADSHFSPRELTCRGGGGSTLILGSIYTCNNIMMYKISADFRLHFFNRKRQTKNRIVFHQRYLCTKIETGSHSKIKIRTYQSCREPVIIHAYCSKLGSG